MDKTLNKAIDLLANYLQVKVNNQCEDPRYKRIAYIGANLIDDIMTLGYASIDYNRGIVAGYSYDCNDILASINWSSIHSEQAIRIELVLRDINNLDNKHYILTCITLNDLIAYVTHNIEQYNSLYV